MDDSIHASKLKNYKRLTSATKVLSGVFFLNLACVACLTTTAAFFDDEGSPAANIIFGLNTFASIFLAVYLLSCFISSRSKDKPSTKLYGWTCWLTFLSTVVVVEVIIAQLLFVTPKTNLVNWIMLGVVITGVVNFVVLLCCCCLTMANSEMREIKPTAEQLWLQRYYRKVNKENTRAAKKKALGIDDVDEEEDSDEGEPIQLNDQQLKSVLRTIFQNQAEVSLAKYGITSDVRSGGGGGGSSFWDSD